MCYRLLEASGGQVGRPGAHSGTGLLAVADWWLANGLSVEEVTEAAAAPARTRVKAKMRMASFMIGNLFGSRFDKEDGSLHTQMLVQIPC